MPKPGKLLVVDDDKCSLDFLTDLLTADGYMVEVAVDAEIALDVAATIMPDLIILDVYMPGMTGFELCRRLKSNSALCDVPVIFISGMATLTDRQKAFKEGAVDYVSKPFEPAEVLARVKVRYELNQARLEIQEKNAGLEKTLAELKAAQTHLIHSEKMATLGVLTAGLTHEINNPVNFISSGVKGLTMVHQAVEQVLDAYDSLDVNNAAASLAQIGELKKSLDYDGLRRAQTELFGSIETGVQRISKIVQGLRMFSKDRGRLKTPAALNENLTAALMLLQGQIKPDIEVEQRLGEIPMVRCYAGQVNQVFINVLTNAMDAVRKKYDGTGGKIVVASRAEDGGVLIEVSDNGIGMEASVTDHIFDPFYTTKDVGSGVGLGLSICHGITSNHGGKLSVTNNDDGGVTTRIWLPCMLEETPSESGR